MVQERLLGCVKKNDLESRFSYFDLSDPLGGGVDNNPFIVFGAVMGNPALRGAFFLL